PSGGPSRPAPDPTPLDLPPFEARRLAEAPGGSERMEEGIDWLLNAGGPIMALDLCPVSSTDTTLAVVGTSCLAPAAGTASDVEVMEEAPGSPRLHVKGRPTREMNLLQIWAVEGGGGGAQKGGSATLLYAIEHAFGPVWDARWLPAEVLGENGGTEDVMGSLVAVFGDGSARVYVLPLPPRLPGPPSAPGPVIPLQPVQELLPPRGTCLTTVRPSPHDPSQLLCGATNGMALLYRLELPLLSCPFPSLPALSPPPPRRLFPARRFYDAREAPLPSLSAVDAVAWHPTLPDLFVTGGHDCSLRLWDLRKPFRPVVERGSFRLCQTTAWLPNGVGCLAGFANGAVRLLGLPEEALRVRFYRHEAPVYDGVTALDAVFDPAVEGAVVVSVGKDGKMAVMVVDKEGLIPRRVGTAPTRTCLMTLMTLRGGDRAVPGKHADCEDAGGKETETRRLTCDLTFAKAPVRGELVEVSPSGVPQVPVRVGLTAARVVMDGRGDPLVGVGGFSGLGRFLGIRRFLT
ncbi:hypothetical protein Naga_100054g1, partial [Nannochloropsis gaditana]